MTWFTEEIRTFVGCVRTVNVAFSSETGDVTLRMEDVASLPESAFSSFSLIAAHQNQMYCKPEENGITLSLLDDIIRFPFDGSSYSKLGFRIDSNDTLPPSVGTSQMMEVESDRIPMALPTPAPGGSDRSATFMDIDDFHYFFGRSIEAVLQTTARALGVELQGGLRPCAGCSTAKGYCTPIGSTTPTRDDKESGRVLVDLGGFC